jgi:hypothetical protein
MVKELPPFSGDDTTCCKCSNEGALTRYIAENQPSCGLRVGLGRPQRLERRCTRCGFEWDEAINPPPAP